MVGHALGFPFLVGRQRTRSQAPFLHFHFAVSKFFFVVPKQSKLFATAPPSSLYPLFQRTLLTPRCDCTVFSINSRLARLRSQPSQHAARSVASFSYPPDPAVVVACQLVVVATPQPWPSGTSPNTGAPSSRRRAPLSPRSSAAVARSSRLRSVGRSGRRTWPSGAVLALARTGRARLWALPPTATMRTRRARLRYVFFFPPSLPLPSSCLVQKCMHGLSPLRRGAAVLQLPPPHLSVPRCLLWSFLRSDWGRSSAQPHRGHRAMDPAVRRDVPCAVLGPVHIFLFLVFFLFFCLFLFIFLDSSSAHLSHSDIMRRSKRVLT